MLLIGRSLGTWKLLYTIFQVNRDTRAGVIPTNRHGVCFYDQTTNTGEIDIDGILERSEAEHTRLCEIGTLPEQPEKPRKKRIRLPVGEYQKIITEHQTHRYTFYEAPLPIAGTNKEPYKIIAGAKWSTTEQSADSDPLISYGIGLPRDEIGQVAFLYCKGEKPSEYPLTIAVFEDGSAELILSKPEGRLTFPKGSYTVSRGQRYRFRCPKEDTPR